MKKKYTEAELEIIKLSCPDVIRTSGENNEEPGVDPDNVFDGGYDINGWT